MFRVSSWSVAVAAAVAGLALPASAAEFVDTGNSSTFFTTATSNLSSFDPGDGDWVFEVAFAEYDGDGGTPEDEKASGWFTYWVGNPNLGIPAGETFVGLTLDTLFWEGRTNFDGQSPADVFTYQLSDDGITFGEVQSLTFDPTSGTGIFPTTGTSGPFTADYVRINITARVEAAGSGFNDPWSSRVTTVTLTSAVPEPGSFALLGLGAVALLRRRAR